MISSSDSIEIELTIYEADGTTPLDFSSAPGALFAIYQKPGNVVARFSKVAKEGYTTLLGGQLTDSNTGKVTIYLNKAESKKLDPNKMTYAEARIGLTNANFTGSLQELTASDIELEEVIRPQLENISTV